MPPDRPVVGSPQDWLARARGDLALARVPLPADAFYEALCFHAQQAAEKALKAVYLHHGWRFKYIHDLAELVAGLKQNGMTVPEDVMDSMNLTSYASATRYPDLDEPVTEDEHRQAVARAEAVVQWAERDLRQGPR